MLAPEIRGIIHQQINCSERRNSCIDQSSHFVGLAEIGCQRQQLDTKLLELACGLLDLVGHVAGDHDFHAFAGQPQRDAFPDAAARSGDDGHFVV